MNLLISLFLGSFVLSALLTWFVRSIALKKQLALPAPRERDIHTKATPRLGGVAVVVTFLVVTLLLWFVRPQELAFYPDTVLGIDKNLFGILAGVLLLLIVGIVDDIKGVSPVLKLVSHVIAGIILAWSMVLVPHMTNPFGGKIELGLLAPFVVVAWVVFVINTINWLDGLDGLASGVTFIATLVLYLLAVKPEVNQLSMSILALILAGALAGFLPFNFYPAKIFLGDSGSQVLGFLLAVFAIISGGKIATAILVLGVPILDVIWVVFRRLASKSPVYKADKFHLHHRLLRAGLHQRQAVLLMYAVSAAFGIVALQTQSWGKFIAVIILVGIMILGGAILVARDTLKSVQEKV